MKISISDSKEWIFLKKTLYISIYEPDILNKFKEHSDYILRKKDKLSMVRYI